MELSNSPSVTYVPSLGLIEEHQQTPTAAWAFSCLECDKIFLHDSHLKRHKRTHTGYKPFVCSECDKTFSQLDGLIKHNRIHTGDKPFSCSSCHKSYSHSSNLKRHERIHTGEKSFSCLLCDRSFRHSDNLNRHKVFHSTDMKQSENIPDEISVRENIIDVTKQKKDDVPSRTSVLSDREELLDNILEGGQETILGI